MIQCMYNKRTPKGVTASDKKEAEEGKANSRSQIGEADRENIGRANYSRYPGNPGGRSQ